MLVLSNFENQITKAIVKRGKDYFDAGAVTCLEESEDRIWQATVEGLESYNVEIELKGKDSIQDYSCDCPYEDDTCKHVAAVLFAIREVLQNKVLQPGRKAVPKPSVNTLLQKISLEEFQGFVREYAKQDKNFQTAFELFFADKDDRIDVSKKYTDLIKALVRQYTNKGFIGYRESTQLSREVSKLLGNGIDCMAKKNFKDAFLIAKVVLEEMTEVQEGCDDSSGDIGAVTSGAISLMEKIADADTAAIAIKEQLYAYLLQESQSNIYFDYGDFGYDMFDILETLAIKLNQHQSFIKFIDSWIAKPDEKYSNYRKEFFKKAKISFLELIGKKDEAAKLVQQNMDIVEVRQAEVEKAIAKKDYALAKKLIQEGITIAEQKSHSGTVSAWEKELLRIAVLQKDRESVRHYTKRFALNRYFNSDYYRQWKKTYQPQEWKPVIDAYISETANRIVKEHAKEKKIYGHHTHPPLLYALGDILIEEQYGDQLLALLQKENRLDNVLKYHSYLVGRFSEEMLQLYLPIFIAKGDSATDRNSYATLAGHMKKVIKDVPAGKERIQAIARQLIQKYPRRPAMVEEMGKVLL